jgi:hypothetical protein
MSPLKKTSVKNLYSSLFLILKKLRCESAVIYMLGPVFSNEKI